MLNTAQLCTIDSALFRRIIATLPRLHACNAVSLSELLQLQADGLMAPGRQAMQVSAREMPGHCPTNEQHIAKP